jgi:hypothetical protein
MADDTTQIQALDSTPKSIIAPVSSGTGRGVNDEAVSAGDFAYAKLGSGTAGGLGNAALLSTTTILPNTRRTQTSKAELEAADRAYTTQMNLLSQHWSTGDTTSPDYEAQKQAALASQYQWELARNKLEEVASADLSNRITPTNNLDGILDGIQSEIDLSGTSEDLSQSSNTEVLQQGSDIVVTGNSAGDERIRIRPRDQAIYGTDVNSPLFLLRETHGVFFPFTPTIDFSHRAEYSQMSPTHANTSYFSYNNTPAVQITITGQFSAQNLAEAKYTLAAMHFFRTVTKMHFGEQEAEEGSAGLPPPVLILSGYGKYMFNDLNVIIQEFKMDLPSTVDYIEVDFAGASAWVPSLTTFTVSCVVQQTPRQQREEFSFTDFANGTLMRDRKGWI